MSDFYSRVYRVCREIPEGKVCSYGAIARFLGAAKSSRMVGYAMNKSFAEHGVPAHRVLNRLGMLTGKHFFPGTNMMQELLENEGLVILDDKVQNFEQHFWDPSEHLDPTKY